MGKLSSFLKKYPYICLIAVLLIAVGFMRYFQLSHKTLEEYAITLESEDHFISGNGMIWVVLDEAESEQQAELWSTLYGEMDENRIIVVNTGETSRRPIDNSVTESDKAKISDTEAALKEYDSFDVFVRKDGSVWVRERFLEYMKEAHIIVRYQK